MAVFNFDGSANITAAKTDTVVISANPALFQNVTTTAGNTVFTFLGGKTLTISGTTYGPSLTQYPNVTLAGGTFATGSSVDTAQAADNLLLIGGTTEDASTGAGVAGGVKAIFGGLGTADSIDTADAITIGGKGSFLVYGNGGDDTIIQSANIFDSTSFVTTFGGIGTDTITYTAANVGAQFAVYGGEGGDTISVRNTGTTANTTIFGGQGAADSTDGADTINFNGGGKVSIFGNAGADTINVGTGTGGFDSTGNATIHGGLNNDSITVTVTAGVSSTVVVYGDENGGTGTETITVTGNNGTTTIYGGTAAADANDGADTITYAGQGTATIYAAGGNDTINLNGVGTATLNQSSTTTAFGGNGADSINIINLTNDAGKVSVTAGAGADVITVGTVGSATAPATGDATVAGVTGGTGTSLTITDFAIAATGGDTLRVQNGLQNGTATTFTAKSAIGATSLQQALDLATGSATQGQVTAVVYNGDAYVVVNDATAGTFSQASDLAIKLTGVTDLVALSAQTQII